MVSIAYGIRRKKWLGGMTKLTVYRFGRIRNVDVLRQTALTPPGNAEIARSGRVRTTHPCIPSLAKFQSAFGCTLF